MFRSVYRHELETRLTHKPLTQEISKVADWPRRMAVAEFRLCIGHDCLGAHFHRIGTRPGAHLHRIGTRPGAHLHRIGTRPDPYCTLRSLHEPMDRNHLGQRTALSNKTECERYWEARTKRWKIDFVILLLPFFCDYPLALGLYITLNVPAIYLLTPWCRFLPEQLTGLQLVKKFPAFHGTQRFITALTSVHHLSLSWASPIQSIYPHPTSWRFILILYTHLGLPSLHTHIFA